MKINSILVLILTLFSSPAFATSNIIIPPLPLCKDGSWRAPPGWEITHIASCTSQDQLSRVYGFYDRVDEGQGWLEFDYFDEKGEQVGIIQTPAEYLPVYRTGTNWIKRTPDSFQCYSEQFPGPREGCLLQNYGITQVSK